MRTAMPLALLATTLTCALFAAPAHARDRVFVASYGNDANPCTFGSPCKTFQAAYDAVATGGEVTAIDSAGFGPLSIRHSVTITSPDGVEAGIAAAAGADAIDINAGPSDVVVLHGLTLDGFNAANNGITVLAVGSLTVENCVIRNMTSNGLDFASSVSTQNLAVSNSFFINNIIGIFIVAESSGAVTAAIDRTGFYGNKSSSPYGLYVAGEGPGPINVAVTDSVAANNNYGFLVQTTVIGAVANLSVTHSLAQGNVRGLSTFAAAGSSPTIWLGQSTATGNGADWYISGGSIMTYVDNYLSAGSGTNTGTLTTVGQQ